MDRPVIDRRHGAFHDPLSQETTRAVFNVAQLWPNALKKKAGRAYILVNDEMLTVSAPPPIGCGGDRTPRIGRMARVAFAENHLGDVA